MSKKSKNSNTSDVETLPPEALPPVDKLPDAEPAPAEVDPTIIFPSTDPFAAARKKENDELLAKYAISNAAAKPESARVIESK